MYNLFALYFCIILFCHRRTQQRKKSKLKKTLPKPGIVQNSFEFSGLNQGPSDLQSDALPTELFRQLMKLLYVYAVINLPVFLGIKFSQLNRRFY